MGEDTDRIQAAIGGWRKRPPTDEVTVRHRRALAKVLAYAIVAIPGAYSAVRSQYQADTTTVAQVNKEASRQVVKLQEWVKANKAEAQAARADLAELRKEIARDRRELTKLLVEIAKSSRTLRAVRAPGDPPPRRPVRTTPAVAAVQKKVDALSKSPKVKSSGSVTFKRPKLQKPAQSLDALKGL